MRTKTFIKFANINEKYKRKKIFKLKYILNVCLLQLFKL